MSTGCARQPEPSEVDSLRVALLLAGPENDEGWNQSAYEGLEAIRQRLSATTRKIAVRGTRSEIEQAFVRAADEGFDLVIGHGVEFNAPAASIAGAHPDVAFVTTGGEEVTDNLLSVELRVEEASYCLGILAGHLSKSGRLSALSGEPYEPVKRVVEGFRRGARSVQPGIEVLEDYVGSWSDVALAKEKAFAHADAGADVFFQNADAAGAGVFEACRIRGLLAFGCNRDQKSKAPDLILASAVADIPETFVALAQEVMQGRFRGGRRSIGMNDGKVRVVLNEALRARVPEAAVAVMNAAAASIADGSLRVCDR